MRLRLAALRCRQLSTIPLQSRRAAAFGITASSSFSGASAVDLARGSVVLTACSQPWLVRHAESALALSDRVLGRAVTESLLRHTVFAHFCAGEDAEAIRPMLRSLHNQGVGGILDFAAEADLDAQVIPDGCQVNQPSRVYSYVSEKACDANLQTFLQAVDAVHRATPEGFAAIKVTALGDPALLERVSTAVLQLQAFFHTLDADGRGKLSRKVFASGWVDAFDASVEEVVEIFKQIDVESSGEIDIVEFCNALPLEAIGPLVRRCRSKGPLYHSALDRDECAALERMLARLDEIAQRAKSKGVRLMIDAEHTYFQPAIDHAVLRLSRTHNREWPVIFGTYQAYLRECNAKLELDLDRARREGWHLGAKLVRGAYMVHERARAAERGYPDPIQPTVEATHASYDMAIDQLLLHCPCPERTSVMVATHNQDSVERVATLLLGDDVGNGSRVPRERVFFGQLLGMADHLTFSLAGHGLKAYKYVPYGPVREVLPYLIRRAQENADALSGATAQRNMMLVELRRRLSP